MSKIYTSSAPGINGQNVTQQAPIDDRMVVESVNDLFDITVMGYYHHGMMVSVVGETGADGIMNGVYWLPRVSRTVDGVQTTYYDKQSWDPEGVDGQGNRNYDAHGWRRMDATSIVMDMNISADDEAAGNRGQFGGNGTYASPYYVKVINGAEYEPQQES